MRAVLLPVKDLRNAKQRLAPILTPQERFDFACAMLADTLRAIQGVRRADRIFVVTNYPPVIQAAEQNAWEVLREERQISESFSVDAASAHCRELGITSVLRLPLDLPLITPADIDELLALEVASPSVIIVPSRDGTGTNAILRTPPTLFPSHFGSGSFAKHCQEARLAGAAIFDRRNPRIAMDVDDEADLRALLSLDLGDTRTGQWLRQADIAARLSVPQRSARRAVAC